MSDYVACAFKSPDQAVRAMNKLKSAGISACIIATPSGARVGCGVSVRIEPNDCTTAQRLLSDESGTLAGFFNVSSKGGRTIVTRR